MPLPFVLAQHTAVSPLAASAEVVVQGERAQPSAPPHERFVAGSVIARERLTQPGVTAAQLLRDEPGAQSTEVGGFGTWSTVSLRGAPAAQTPVYFGVLRLNDEFSGTANLSDVPLFFVQRAEVFRSHAPAFVEQLGVGGALYFEPRRADKNELSAHVLFGSYGFRSARGYAASRAGERRLLAAVELTGADNDYTFPNSKGTLWKSSDDQVTRLSNADMSQKNLWLSASDRVQDAQVRVTYYRSQREQGALKLAVTQAEHARVETGRDAAALESTLPLPSIAGQLGLATSALISETSLFDPDSELSLAASRTTTRGQRVEQAAYVQHALSSRLRFVERLTLGFEGLQRFEERDTTYAERLTARRARARLSLSHEAQLTDELSVSALASLGAYATSGEDQKNLARYEPEGRLGAAYRIGPSELYCSVGHYRRRASLAELFGASALVRGNPALRSEQGTTLELGYRQQWLDMQHERVAWLDAATFARLSRDLIAYDTTAQGYLLPKNRKQTRALGAELSLGVRALEFLRAELNVSLIDARDVSPDRVLVNEILPFVSRATVSSLLALEHAWRDPLLSRASLGLRGSYKSSRYANPAGAGVIPEQTIFDIEATAHGLFETLTARLRVADVFDVARFDVVGFPLPRRSWYLALETVL